jgi:hypothetical protein
MATSGVYTYSASQTSIITGALRKINVVGDFETLSTSDNRYLAAVAALNPLVKSYHALGMPIWAVTETTIPFSNFSTTAPVVIGLGQTINQVAPLKVIQALRRDNLAGIDVPINIYTYEDYELLLNKGAVGAPIHLFYHPLRNTGNLNVWPLPDSSYWQVNGSLYIRYHRPYQDFTTGTDEPDFPIEWNRLLVYALGADLAPEYGLDTEQRQMLERERDKALETVLSFGTEEGGLFIQPRTR